MEAKETEGHEKSEEETSSENDSESDSDGEERSEDENDKEQKEKEKKEKLKKKTKFLFKAVSLGTRFNVAPRSFSVTKEFKVQNPIRSGRFILSNMKIRKFPVEEMKKLELDKIREFDPKRPPFGQKFPLRFLDLSLNNICSSMATMVLPFTQLEELNLNCNFIGLQEKHENEPAYFTDNDGHFVTPELTTMKPDGVVDFTHSFSSLKALTNLDLSINWLTEIPQFGNVTEQLKKLNLSKNSIQKLPDTLPNFTSLNILNLSRNNIPSLPSKFLDSFPSITSLDLSENNIEEIPSDFGFSESMRVFVLRENNIHTLPPNFWSFFGDKLKDISLQNNALRDLPIISSPLNSLEVLNISQNKLNKIPTSFENTPKLEVLNIENNLIQEIPDVIGIVSRLTRFLASKNEISYVSGAIGNLKELAWLDLSFNKLTSLPKELGLLDDKLYLLNLRRNVISTEEALEPIWSMRGLSELDLSENNISRISENINNLNQIFTLKISGNYLTEDSLPSLKGISAFGSEEVYQASRSCLYLNDNSFKHFPTNLYELRGLQVLSIDTNPLIQIPTDLKSMVNLKVLSMSLLSVEDLNLDQINLPQDIERFYFKIHPDESIARKFNSLFPSYMIDTDLVFSDKAPQLYKKTLNLIRGPATREIAFAQMMGVGVHPLEDSVSYHSWSTPFGVVEFYAVFDGHGGLQTSSYLQDNLYKEIQAEMERVGNNCLNSMNELICKCFKEVNYKLKEMFKAPTGKVEGDGSTAVVILIVESKIFCANCGDSRAALISCEGEKWSSEFLTIDHKPADKNEEKRIRKAGGYINASSIELNHYRLFNPGVTNGISVCRSFGDFPLSPAMTQEPRVISFDITEKHKYLILACDGIWDVLDSDRVAEIINHELKRGSSLNWIASSIRGWAFSIGSGDDMSVMIIKL